MPPKLLPPNFFKSLIAVVLGNILYFVLAPHLPRVARHAPMKLDLGLIVDFWVCVVVYGVLGLIERKRRPAHKSDVN
ncbi:MAG TPA: hypothetical protein VF786_13405 [Terriglobales bacterium]